jgi:CRISPR/Cas system-associated exonuclease Cas4 (RecB family)
MKSISRTEMFARMGLVSIVDPLVERAYEKELAKKRDFRYRTAFHASAFPADDEKACGRKAMYQLMSLPGEDFTPYGMAIMDAGNDLERNIVRKLEKLGGALLHPASSQVKFTLPSHWLTGYTDAVIEVDGRPFPIEIKGKDSVKIREMKSGKRHWDSQHRNQLLCYLGIGKFTNTWPELKPMADGALYYVARDRPRETMEFYFSYNADAFKAGLDHLETWQQHWLTGELPPRPKDWRWTELPCKWCDFKKICKGDIGDDVTKLEDSRGVKVARDAEPTWSLAGARDAIAKRWTP